jgi:biotin-[acetyl-CoA-carboxylase] ligase BirA-like protein
VSEDLTLWAELLESTIENEKLSLFDRAFVLSATSSTQDAARRLCGNSPGAVVIAGRQLEGRGRMGRAWDQRGEAGLAITFVLPAQRFASSHLSVAGGLAALRAIESCLAADAAKIGLRWPNDVVTVADDRKLAGVLIEIIDSLALVGIGINVHAMPDGWPSDLSGAACSIADLGGRIQRIELAQRLMVCLHECVQSSTEQLTDQWMKRDTLQGRRARFLCGGECYDGTVDSISPLHEIALRLDSGMQIRLSAAQTTRLR